jgi:hypothetical protein
MSKGVRSTAPSWVAVLGAALALSACSSPSSTGVLSQVDIPSYLGVQPNSSATAFEASHASPPAHCVTTGLVLFSEPGKRVDTSTRPPERTTTTPIIVSSSVSCASIADAKIGMREGGALPGTRSVTGIGDKATFTDLSDRLNRSYVVQWRDDNRGGFIWAIGAPNDKRITPGLAEELARRAAARP